MLCSILLNSGLHRSHSGASTTSSIFRISESLYEVTGYSTKFYWNNNWVGGIKSVTNLCGIGVFIRNCSKKLGDFIDLGFVMHGSGIEYACPIWSYFRIDTYARQLLSCMIKQWSTTRHVSACNSDSILVLAIAYLSLHFVVWTAH